MPEISISGGSITDTTTGSPEITYLVTVSGPVTTQTDVSYRVLHGGGTALAVADYLIEANTITFLPGQAVVLPITIQVVGDTADEADEAVVVELYNPTGGATLAGGGPTLRSTGWILDDDGGGSNLALFVSSPQVVEGDDGQKLAVFELRLSRPPGSDVTLNYQTVDGSATAGNDYQAVNGTVTFTANQVDPILVQVPVFTDIAVEVSETFSLAVTPTGAIANGFAGSTGEATILDDDAGTGPVISISGGQIVETTAVFPLIQYVVTLSEPASQATSVSFRTLHGAGTAVAGIDYLLTGNTITFQPGESSIAVTVQVNENIANSDEFDEAVVLELYNPTGGARLAGGGPTLRSTGWILDDEGGGSNQALFVSSPQIVEGDSGERLAVFELQLSQVPTSNITLGYQTVNGSATGGQDYQATSGTVTFLAGQTIASVAVPVFGDLGLEVSETFSLVVTPTADIANGFAGSTGEATILDDDAGTGPVISISGGQIPETTALTTPMIQYVVTLSEPAAQPVQVSFRVLHSAGTALAVADHIVGGPATNTVTFDVGQSSLVIPIQVTTDMVDEADEAVVLELFNATGGATLAGGGPTLRSTGWILDDDPQIAMLPSLFVSSPQLVEGDSGSRLAVFELQLSQVPVSNVTLNYQTVNGSATAGRDFQATSGAVTFLAGQTVSSVAVPVYGDTGLEVSESFSLVVTPTGAIANGTEGSTGEAVILDDDAGTGPVISISAGRIIDTEAIFPEIEYVVTLSEPATQPMSVSYRTLNTGTAGTGTATSTTDYFVESNTINFAVGQSSSFPITIQVVGDSADEIDESVVLELFNPTGGAALAGGGPALRAAGWILDDDGGGSNLAVAATGPQVFEGMAGQRLAVFDLQLSRAAASSIILNYQTLDGTATAGQDYQAASGTVTFAPGQTVASVAVQVFGDEVFEASETFSLSISGGGLASVVGQATIVNDDTDDPPQDLTGGAGPDPLTGKSRNDTLRGLGGNDVLTGLAGNDALEGGTGFDIAVYRSNLSRYDVLSFAGVTIVAGGIDGMDLLTGVELLSFADRAMTAFPSSLDYIASYGDLSNAFGTNRQAGLDHFRLAGYAEGRHVTFDGLDYIASHPGLMNALGASDDAGATHFILYGRFEGRQTTFNALNYIASHGGLIDALGANEDAGATHYILFGHNEGRQTTFQPLNYVASYGGLIDIIGANAEDAAAHYIRAGFHEGRQTTFDGLAYIASYADLSSAFGLNEEAGARHFIENGFHEGRKTSFNGLEYIASYAGLMDVFGANEDAGTAHFIQFGRAEGRQTTFDGLKYIASYGDLIHAFRANEDAGATHFIQSGRFEGRTVQFDPASYLANYPGLQAIFGNDLEAATVHFINFGYDEGRHW